MDRIRVGMIDPTGLWGPKIVKMLSRSSRVNLAFSVFRPGPELNVLLKAISIAGPEAHWMFPGERFLNGDGDEFDLARQELPAWLEIQPLNLLSYAERCDVLIDMSGGGNSGAAGTDDYHHFRGPVVRSHAFAGSGLVIAPPIFTTKDGGNRYRQSVCILSGIVPVLRPFVGDLCSIRMQVTMQNDRKSTDFLTSTRIGSIAVVPSYASRLESELEQLVPGVDVCVSSVIQRAELAEYPVTLELELRETLSLAEILDRLRRMPRVRVIDSECTFDIARTRSSGAPISPVTILEPGVRVLSRGHAATRVVMVVTLQADFIAVTPFLDAILTLGGRMDPEAAMRCVDEELGFSAKY